MAKSLSGWKADEGGGQREIKGRSKKHRSVVYISQENCEEKSSHLISNGLFLHPTLSQSCKKNYTTPKIPGILKTPGKRKVSRNHVEFVGILQEQEDGHRRI